jgi:ion channel-forming bestrophin family protein
MFPFFIRCLDLPFPCCWFFVPIWLTTVVVFVFYVLESLEVIAEEIEEPFGKDANDLPLQRSARLLKGM